MVRTRTKDYGYYLNHNNNSMSYDDNLESSDEDDISSQFSTRMNISASDNKESESEFESKKKEATKLIELYLAKIKEFVRDSVFSTQSLDKNPEYMNTIYNLFDTVIDNEYYLISSKEKSNLYKISCDKLYHIIQTLFVSYKRADLAYNLYYHYKDFYNISYKKCFLLEDY